MAKLLGAHYMDTNPDPDDVNAELQALYENSMSFYRSRSKTTVLIYNSRANGNRYWHMNSSYIRRRRNAD